MYNSWCFCIIFDYFAVFPSIEFHFQHGVDLIRQNRVLAQIGKGDFRIVVAHPVICYRHLRYGRNEPDFLYLLLTLQTAY